MQMANESIETALSMLATGSISAAALLLSQSRYLEAVALGFLGLGIFYYQKWRREPDVQNPAGNNTNGVKI